VLEEKKLKKIKGNIEKLKILSNETNQLNSNANYTTIFINKKIYLFLG